MRRLAGITVDLSRKKVGAGELLASLRFIMDTYELGEINLGRKIKRWQAPRKHVLLYLVGDFQEVGAQ